MDPVKKPWGGYRVLEDAGFYVVKELIINPGHRISLQAHRDRVEYWVRVDGKAVVTCGSSEFSLSNRTMIIEKLVKHRIKNVGTEDLIVIEVQVGECDEDDIVRYEDDYGRV